MLYDERKNDSKLLAAAEAEANACTLHPKHRHAELILDPVPDPII